MRTHGTPSAYNHGGCRCDQCTAANAKYQREKRARRMTEPVPAGVKHGASAAVNYGCKCDTCNEGIRLRNVRLQERVRSGGIKHHGGSTSGCPCENCKLETSKRQKRYFAANNGASLNEASRHRYIWTGPELELADRKDLTAKEIAHMIGRTVASVQAMRRRLRFDPRVDYRAGLGDVL